MSKLLSTALALAAVGFAAGSARADEFALDAQTNVLAPITHGTLTLMPVVTTRKGPGRDYLVLDEGMKKKKVRIVETGDVNQLTLRNSSDQPLFLMAGEVILGGKQDRIIGKDTVVPPRKKETIPVFCVEHGRWSGRHADFQSAGALAHTKLRNKANYADQGQVWDEVAKKNAKDKTENDTGTYRRIATGGGDSAKAVAGYEKAFDAALGRVEGAERMVGFVVAVNGKVVGVDVFGSPALFKKLRHKLLRSYFVEAVDLPAAAKPAPPPDAAAVKGFVKSAEAAKADVVVDSPAARTEHRKAKGVVDSKVVDKAPAAAQPAEVFHSVYAE